MKDDEREGNAPKHYLIWGEGDTGRRKRRDFLSPEGEKVTLVDPNDIYVRIVALEWDFFLL